MGQTIHPDKFKADRARQTLLLSSPRTAFIESWDCQNRKMIENSGQPMHPCTLPSSKRTVHHKHCCYRTQGLLVLNPGVPKTAKAITRRTFESYQGAKQDKVSTGPGKLPRRICGHLPTCTLPDKKVSYQKQTAALSTPHQNRSTDGNRVCAEGGLGLYDQPTPLQPTCFKTRRPLFSLHMYIP